MAEEAQVIDLESYRTRRARRAGATSFSGVVWIPVWMVWMPLWIY